MVRSKGHERLLRKANGLVDAVRDDPVQVAKETATHLAGDLPDDVRTVMMRAAGLASRYAGTVDESIQLLAASRDLAASIDEPALAAEASLSLAGSLALSGDTEAALEELQPDPAHPSHLAARYDFQRASVLGRLGRAAEALSSFENALPRFQSFGDLQFEAFTRANLGRLRLDVGDLDGAEEDLKEAIRLHSELGNEVSVAYQNHNLGEVSACRGDLVSALTQLNESSEALQRLTTTSYEPQVSLGETLIAAGLYEEAAALAQRLDNDLKQTNLSLDRAEAQLLLARAYVGLRRWTDAQVAADRAAMTFSQQGREAWVHRAALLAIHSTPFGGDDSGLATSAADLAAELQRLGQHGTAAEATAEGVVRFCKAGMLNTAETHLRRLTDQPGSAWMERRFLTTYARANWHAARGDRKSAFRAIRHGIEISERHRLSLGATELVAGTASHTASLLNLARQLALESTDQRTFFRWSERSRASAMRLQPLLPPVDERLATSLAELRSAERQLAAAELADQPVLAAKHAKAAQRLVERERLVQRPQNQRAEQLTEATLAEVKAKLARPTSIDQSSKQVPRALLSLSVVDEQVWAQLFHGARVRRIDLGGIQELAERFTRLRRRVDALVRVSATDRSATTIIKAIEAERQQLDVMFDFLPEQTSLVLVPPPALFDAPWRLLRNLSGRQLLVAPSCSLWARSAQSAGGEGVGFIAGPDLSLAQDEVEACARQYKTGRPLVGEGATTDAVVGLLEHVDLAHITCHGRFRRCNAQLSALQLADGQLMVLELERLRRTPRCVVLSACSASASDSMDGSEILGLVATFLGRGSEAVMAGNGLLQDSQLTVSVMAAFHERLAAGDPPEAALLAASGIASQPGDRLLIDAGLLVYGTMHAHNLRF